MHRSCRRLASAMTLEEEEFNLQTAILFFCFHSSETTERTSMKLGTIDHDPRESATRSADVITTSLLKINFLIRTLPRRNAIFAYAKAITRLTKFNKIQSFRK